MVDKKKYVNVNFDDDDVINHLLLVVFCFIFNHVVHSNKNYKNEIILFYSNDNTLKTEEIWCDDKKTLIYNEYIFLYFFAR